MTCIIGLENKGKVYMGADSASSNGYSINVSGNPKLFRSGPFLIGFTSSWRMGQLLQHQLGDVALQTTVAVLSPSVYAPFHIEWL